MKSELITFFEDYTNDFPDYGSHLNNLYSLKDIVGKNNFSLQIDGTLQIKHYIGFFQKGNTRVQILPKIFAKLDLGGTNEEEISKSLDFVYRLLYWSGFLSFKPLSPQFQSSSDTDLLEIFIKIFIDEFIDLFRKRVYYKYEQKEENLPFIKGKILFSETVKRNPILRHLHYIRYDEYTINNPLNQIFKALIYQLLIITKDGNNKKQLVIGLNYLQEVDLIDLNPGIFKMVRFDRLNNEFEPLYNFANLFVHNLQPGISEGNKKTFSFLVPIHQLFENFVAKVLQGFSQDEIKFQYHKPSYYYGFEGTEKVFQLEPDFTIMCGNDCLCILDTKYKYPYNQKNKPVIDEMDLYQLSTYAIRYNCNSLVLIYPKFLHAPIKKELLTEYTLLNASGNINLKVVQIDIMQNDFELISDSIKDIITGIILEKNLIKV